MQVFIIIKNGLTQVSVVNLNRSIMKIVQLLHAETPVKIVKMEVNASGMLIAKLPNVFVLNHGLGTIANSTGTS